jgi:hypothetical protein
MYFTDIFAECREAAYRIRACEGHLAEHQGPVLV